MGLAYFPMYPADFEADTSHLTLEEDGAYNRLLRLMWMTPGCSLPDDDAWLARRLRVSPETMAKVVRPLIGEFMQTKNGRVFSARLQREFKKADETSTARSRAGKRGGRPKAIENKQQDEKPGFSDGKAGLSDTRALPEPEPEDTQAIACDADASPAASPSEVFTKEVFDRAVAFLGKSGTPERQARSLVGKWRKEFPEKEIFNAFAAAGREGVTDPVPWITARLAALRPAPITFDMSQIENMQ
jgi:uncharacterized protein YdaU (DUF1376 family)